MCDSGMESMNGLWRAAEIHCRRRQASAVEAQDLVAAIVSGCYNGVQLFVRAERRDSRLWAGMRASGEEALAAAGLSRSDSLVDSYRLSARLLEALEQGYLLPSFPAASPVKAV